jgi:hypothetical protein
MWSFEGDLAKFCGFFCATEFTPQAVFAFPAAASSVAGLGTCRVRDMREVFMTFSEGKLKGLEAFISNIYHVHCSLQNLLHQRAERLCCK